MSDLLARMKRWLQYPRLSSGETLMGEAVQKIERLTGELSGISGELAECRKLLREACEVSRCDDEWHGNQIEDDWFVRAEKA